jgi:hypothetical protein
MRGRLGRAAFHWWQVHAAPPVAAATWERVLAEAAGMQAPRRPADWPAHLDTDGGERARTLLADMGVSVDFLERTR